MISSDKFFLDRKITPTTNPLKEQISALVYSLPGSGFILRESFPEPFGKKFIKRKNDRSR
jgi:hypothetical protein